MRLYAAISQWGRWNCATSCIRLVASAMSITLFCRRAVKTFWGSFSLIFFMSSSTTSPSWNLAAATASALISVISSAFPPALAAVFISAKSSRASANSFRACLRFRRCQWAIPIFV